ncbi:hypothetical protein ACR77J_07315 [Tissierella praeacuta]|uniref:hypothetical protein n=1 Tax=Tissierella praeacuta TaxID=43131 RepID=UPI003DA524A0
MTEKEKKVIELYKSGFSHRQVAEKIGISRSGTYYILKKYNIDTNRSNDFYDKRTYKMDDNYFNKIDDEHKAYWLGFLYADGYNHEERGVVSLTLQSQDLHILEQFKKDIQYDGNFVIDRGYVRLSLNSQQVSRDLAQHGCTHRKTFTLTYPDFLPKNLHSHFIRGYFDGDGSIWYDKQSKSYRIQVIGTESVLKGIVQHLDIHLNRLIPVVSNEYTYRLNYSGNYNVSNIMSRIYKDSTVHLERKHKRYENMVNMMKHRVAL